jgi:hypothetical protein
MYSYSTIPFELSPCSNVAIDVAANWLVTCSPSEVESLWFLVLDGSCMDKPVQIQSIPLRHEIFCFVMFMQHCYKYSSVDNESLIFQEL